MFTPVLVSSENQDFCRIAAAWPIEHIVAMDKKKIA